MKMTIKTKTKIAHHYLPVLASVSILAAALLLSSVSAFCKPKVLDPKVSLVEGDVIRKVPEITDWSDAIVGDHLVSGENLKTGIKSRSEVEFASGRMRLYQNSVLVVPEISTDEENTSDIRHVEVEEGAGIFNILKRGRKKGFTFGTKHIIGGVKGTIFSLKSWEDRTEVAVMRGSVEIADRKNPKNKIILTKGQKITFWAASGFDSTDEAEPEEEEEVDEESSGGSGGKFGPIEHFKDPDEWKDWSDNYDLVLDDSKTKSGSDDRLNDMESDGDSGDNWSDDCPPENDKSDPITR
jgi:hypothetical protein